jgi:hypothetical protein
MHREFPILRLNCKRNRQGKRKGNSVRQRRSCARGKSLA